MWRDTWRGAAQLPRAIRVSVRDFANLRVLAVSTSALIRAELPARCAAAKTGAQCVQTETASDTRLGRKTSFGASAEQIGQP
jgi:hypothetical protein